MYIAVRKAAPTSATALEEQYGAEAEAHSTELAYHFAEAELVLGNEKLVRYSRLAGEQALATYAWEDAAAHFQQALEAKEGESTASGPVNDADTAALLLGFGQAESYTARWEMAVKSLARALDYFEGSLDFCRKAGYRPELAWACHDYADMQHARGQEAEALTPLDEALSISTGLGMRPVMEKVTSLRMSHSLTSTSSPAPASWTTARRLVTLTRSFPMSPSHTEASSLDWR